MADAVSQTFKTQKLTQEIPSSHASTSKFFNHFLYKAAIVTIFFILLPFFPSQAPEFVNQTINARSWELLQLVFVGIAVSYGLFSKKNDETDKDNTLKLDNAQSYVSKLLQVSSVFDDETESPAVIDENKVQTWNSQYYRGEPVVVVAKQSLSPVVKEEKGPSSGITQKSLLLPVRSLKQRVSDPNEIDLVDDLGGKKGTFNKSSSKRFSSNSRNEEFEGRLESKKLEEKVEENVVFRSPIPWRSRSGRMEIMENEDCPSSYTSFSPCMGQEDSELIRLESRSFKSSRPSSSPKNLSPFPPISSPRKLSPSTSFSSESQAKSSEDGVRKKNLSSTPTPTPTPPPPPPPPPPPFLRKSVLMKSNSSVMDSTISPERVLRRSVRSVPTEELSEIDMEEEQPRKTNSGPDSRGKSVRTFRPIESVIGTGSEKKSTEYETIKFIEKKIVNPAMQTQVTFPTEERNKFNEKVLVETTDEESESEVEDSYLEGIDNSVNDVGPDVDKKADEFIAKFREQIRLQRIESIRKSTTQRAGKNSSLLPGN